MARKILGVLIGFIAWVIAWVSGEKVISAIWPDSFGAQQRAFQEAVENGGQFTAESSLLLTHIALGLIVSLLAGFVAALVAGENKRAPVIVGFLLLALGLLKAAMSWPHVPIWYHVTFTALLLPMAVVGGRLRGKAQEKGK